MSEKNPVADPLVDEIMGVASSWLHTGLSIGQAALSATAESIKATADSLARFANDLDD